MKMHQKLNSPIGGKGLEVEVEQIQEKYRISKEWFHVGDVWWCHSDKFIPFYYQKHIVDTGYNF